MIIALDGTAAAGKTTIARALSRYLGVTHINTGACYRAVALYALENDLKADNPHHVQKLINEMELSTLLSADDKYFMTTSYTFDGRRLVDRSDDLFTAKVGDLTRAWSPISSVRAFCTRNWQSWVESAESNVGGCVAEGRDVGRVFPKAALKIWVTANLDSRVLRRALQSESTEEAIRSQLSSRDDVDAEMGNRPLDDAFILDTSAQSVDQALASVKNVMRVLGIKPI